MKLLRNQQGSSHIVAIVGVLVIAAVAFAGYRVLNNSNTTDTTASSITTSSAKEAAAPATVSSKADVQKASTALDTTSIDGTLDSDINNLQ